METLLNTQNIHCLGIFAVSYLYGTFCFVGKLKLFLHFLLGIIHAFLLEERKVLLTTTSTMQPK